MADLALLENTTPQQKERIESIKQSGESLLEILNEILDLSKIEAEKIELESIAFNPMEVVERVARMLSIKIYEKNLELICKIDPAIPDQVIGDPTRFRQIILNLISNAYKFTDQGEICIEASILDSSEQIVVLGFVVSDTGIGIPKQNLQRIFQSFQQAEASISRKYGGTGLGLSITRKLLDLMKGEIRVESEHGKGSKFLFSIPFKRFSNGDARPSVSNIGLEHFSPVLIIEKDQMAAKASSSVFDSLPLLYEIMVLPVVNLENFTKTLTNQQLIVVDSGVLTTTGKKLADELPGALKGLRNTPVIVMAPSTVNLNREDLLVRGLFSILRKPLFPRDIKATLSEQIKQIDLNLKPDQQDVLEIPVTGPLHILLAEDNPINTKLAAGLIQLKNWKVDCAVNGLEAVEMFKVNTYDLVLMDIQMPEMDGMEATQKIRQLESVKGLRAVPIVALSAHAMKGDIDKALRCGMDDYITKPFKPNELYSIIEKLTRLKPDNILP
jgi:CheY-like chemotaxis protein/anti-sigma regulatory factor (Ser/Thr protein kinase)